MVKRRNYLLPRAILASRVDGDSHKWIDAGNQGKTDEIIRKKKSRRSHSAPPFYKGKKKFFATKSRSVWRLHCSAEAIRSELLQSSRQCDQSSTQKCSKGVFSYERPSVKMELVNIWNSKLQAQGIAQVYVVGSQKKVNHFCHLFLT
ncbi:hypothetical protein RDI58_005723 [Solanum bulbocastanum]|uniref:Uncharacterized protein n=1 Tax=Solanum bulbocastanum TaxID=147425 RepID=A0AAN8U843_SOLBU